MSASRREFEERTARDHGETVEAMGRRGCYSGLYGGEWVYRAVPVEFTPSHRARALEGLVNACRFGETPPTNGAGG